MATDPALTITTRPCPTEVTVTPDGTGLGFEFLLPADLTPEQEALARAWIAEVKTEIAALLTRGRN